MEKFKKTHGSYIFSERAEEKITRHNQQQIKAGKKEDQVIQSQFFGKTMLKEMLKRKTAVGIRIHYGINDEGIPDLVLIPIDENGNKVIAKDVGPKDEPEGHGSDGPVCPRFCG